MSTARHHAEWLSLLEISGPFLSMPVLLNAFPQELEAHDPDHAHELRRAYEEWLDNQGSLRPDPAIHTAWVRYVLANTLELTPEVLAEGQRIPEGIKASFPEHQEVLRPDLMVADPGSGRPRLLIHVFPAGQDMEKPLPNRNWKASPATRMMELLHATEVQLGLITNGEQWMLVNAPRGETTGFVTWYAELWPEEPLTLRAFRSLLRMGRFFGVPDDQTLEALLAASTQDQHEVTDQLGAQVLRAVEILVQDIDRADQDRGRELLAGLSMGGLYEAALTVMMRLVFLLAAEERGMLLLGDPLYDQNYAVSTLRAQLRELADRHGEEVLERRCDAWSRVLALWRAVYAGIGHENLLLPAYGGGLFDPDRFPFLEGRPAGSSWRDTPARPLPINNRTVLHLLEALQILQVKVPGGGPAEARRLSFRALDIEQIGHVYEGLLDHVAVRAGEPILGMAGTRNKGPEIALAELERQRGRGEAAFVAYLQEQTGRSANGLNRALKAQVDAFRLQRLRAVCQNDDALYRRVLPFAALVRDDDYNFPVVIPAGSVYVTAGATRRATGTHYTPRSLTEPIVQHTLEPLVYVGPAEGLPREQWQLKSAADLLSLKVCDMAMGSGAFLVQACRYLSERLAEAWEAAAAALASMPGEPDLRITPEGKRATGDPAETIIPKDAAERLALARRLIADRCLYGVDKNPLAVEMAKLSLWLITMDKGRPFTFLDHALKCGDSLVGVNFQQLRHWNLNTEGTAELFAWTFQTQIEEMVALRRRIAALPVTDVTHQQEKARLLARAEAIAHDLRQACDALVLSYFNDLSAAGQVSFREALLHAHRDGVDVPGEWRKFTLGDLRPFHWELEFPEVFLSEGRNGFDAFVGNPPFVGGMRIKRTFGEKYQQLLQFIYSKSSRNADLAVYFLLRGFSKISDMGYLGLISTKTVSEGDSRESGLLHIVECRGKIIRAVTSQAWSGSASVLVSVTYITRVDWKGDYVLDGRVVPGISSYLTPETEFSSPFRLAEQSRQIFTGVAVYGEGFLLTDEEAAVLIQRNPQNRDVVQKYMTGKTFCSSSQLRHTGWIINFSDKSEDEARAYTDCYSIVEKKVKPYRSKINREAYRKYWWQFGEKRPGLFSAIFELPYVMVTARVSKYIMFSFLPTEYVFLNTLFVVPRYEYRYFSILQSDIHTVWALHNASSVGATTQYTPDDCFDTFPLPTSVEHQSNTESLDHIGQDYYVARASIIAKGNLSLTDTYNSFHNPGERAADIAQLRDLHVQMDEAVAAAYGWGDLGLGHGFHQTAQGLRFTISESARREVLSRLLRLNHERYAEEVRQGLHDKGSKKGKGTKGKNKASASASAEQPYLFEEDE